MLFFQYDVFPDDSGIDNSAASSIAFVMLVSLVSISLWDRNSQCFESFYCGFCTTSLALKSPTIIDLGSLVSGVVISSSPSTMYILCSSSGLLLSHIRID